MNYDRFDTTNLFLPDNGLEDISYAYFFTANNIIPVPALITLEQSWSTYLGFYVFLSGPVKRSDKEAMNALAVALLAEKKMQDPENPGVVWLSNAKAPLDVFTTLKSKKSDGITIISEKTDLGFGTYGLPLMAGAPLQFDVARAELQIGYPQVAGAGQSAVDQGMRIAVQGDKHGVVFGQVVMNDYSDTPETGWSVGFKYFMTYGGGLSQFYPVFDNEAGHYTLFNMQWDPLHPVDSSRTKLNFTGISFKIVPKEGSEDQFEIQSVANPNVFSSFWRTLFGKAILLRPTLSGLHPAQLVFQDWEMDSAQKKGYYLSLKGEFELIVPGEEGKQLDLLCGLSGTECLKFTAGDPETAGTGDLLTFYPDQAAYTKDFPVVSNSAGLANVFGAQASDGFLDKTYKTAWASIRPNGTNPNVLYFASPEKAGLYRSSALAGILGSYYAETARFTNTVYENGEGIFPMVPYAGIIKQQPGSFDPGSIQDFELQIIASERNSIIATIPLTHQDLVEDDPLVLSTTPQGLLATIQGLSWKEVLLAQNTEIPDNFSFIDLPNRLRNAFQSNELFLVASDATNLGTFQNAVSIEGWKFNVNVPTRNPLEDQDQENILLLKFRKGTILDLIQDVNSWTDANNFNYNADQVVSTQTWLIQYCNEAIDLASQNEGYAQFASLIQDPNWYGVLSLKVNIDLGAFPQDLKGLLGAMDLSRFYAHHVGVQINYIQEETAGENQDPVISVKKSNLFGLISYIDAAYQQSLTGSGSLSSDSDPSLEQVSYAYKVLTLQVVFANSAITDFNSKLLLTARKWFEEDASLNIPSESPPSSEDNEVIPANYAMLFNGHYENHDGHRTYTFLTQKNQYYQYFISSKVLNYVDFVKAQFSTLSVLKDSPSSIIENVNCQFTFYGYLNFLKQDGFDFFSYGCEKGDELRAERGLYFSNLALDITFKLDTEKYISTELSITFNPKQVAFDQSMSNLRKASLGKAFPLSPSAIIMGRGDQTPPKSGYVHVSPPNTYKSQSLDSVWFGLDLELLWGGPGALADQAGFIPHVLMAWSPGGDSPSTEILIRLPGSSSGGKTLSLQNVIQLKVGTFRFTITEQTDKISYNLLLTSIGLSIIGLKFPPVGNTNLMLLGDPEQPGTMGWYGAYINK